jgi:hypothetical protein
MPRQVGRRRPHWRTGWSSHGCSKARDDEAAEVPRRTTCLGQEVRPRAAVGHQRMRCLWQALEQWVARNDNRWTGRLRRWQEGGRGCPQARHADDHLQGARPQVDFGPVPEQRRRGAGTLRPLLSLRQGEPPTHRNDFQRTRLARRLIVPTGRLGRDRRGRKPVGGREIPSRHCASTPCDAFHIGITTLRGAHTTAKKDNARGPSQRSLRPELEANRQSPLPPSRTRR